eukprot:TRINITY_DN7605_c0_g1_i1.p1 TRINITY_DN7605_c0_g1~~TRINITY_DN7605_c0_g1_i1.p1  ORF type:complete len:1855 (-),score=416.20 TRINITY_DN7605_c0_g1_i1:64-5628(-)
MSEEEIKALSESGPFDETSEETSRSQIFTITYPYPDHEHWEDVLAKLGKIKLNIPSDNASVVAEERVFRTVGPSVPEEFLDKEGKDYVYSCCKFYKQDWISIKNIEEDFLNRSLHEQYKEYIKNMEPPEYELDLNASEPTPDRKNPIDQAFIEAKITGDKKLLKDLKGMNRQNFFGMYPMAVVYDPPNVLSNAKHIREFHPKRILVEAKSLYFDAEKNNPIEPMFCSMVLYDLEAKERVSETFEFTLSADKSLSMLDWSPSDPETRAKNAVFYIHNPNPNIHLVLTIFRILGDSSESDVNKFYINYEKKKDKHMNKFRATTAERIGRTGYFTEMFAMDHLQVFDEEGNMILEDESSFQNMHLLTKIDKNIYNTVSSLGKGKKKKSKIIPGQMMFSVHELSEEDSPPGCIDTSYRALIPETDDSEALIKEMEGFKYSIEAPLPHMTFKSILYLYPESLTLRSVKSVIMEVKLLENDDIIPSSVSTIFGDFSGPSFVEKKLGSVQYHNRRPHFNDQFKILLPTILTSFHHLVVSFYHVVLKKKSNDETLKLIAQTSIPLYPDGSIIKNGHHSIPIMSALPEQGYLNDENLKYMDHGKEVFTFNINISSTIVTQDPILHSLFIAQAGADLDLKLTSLKGIQEGNESTKKEMVHYLPTLMNILLEMLSNDPVEILQKEIFSTILFTIETIFEISTNNFLMESYIKYSFTNPDTEKPVYESLVETLLVFMKMEHEIKVRCMKSCPYLFGLIFKSLCLQSSELGYIGEIRDFVSIDFLCDLKLLFGTITKFLKDVQIFSPREIPLIRFVNQYIAFFTRDLFDVIDRGVCFGLVETYCNEICSSANPDDKPILEVKWIFLKTISDHDHFISLNAPFPFKLNDIKIDVMQEQFAESHFLAGLILEQLRISISAITDIRSSAIGFFRDILWRLDHISLNQRAKHAIGQIFFPFVTLVLDNEHNLLPSPVTIEEYKLSLGEYRTWLACFIFVLKNVDRSLLKHWWKRDTERRKLAFLNFLMESQNHLAYVGEKLTIHRKYNILEPVLTHDIFDNISNMVKYDPEERAANMKKNKKGRKKNKKKNEATKQNIPNEHDTVTFLKKFLKREKHPKYGSTMMDVHHDSRVIKEAWLGREVVITIMELLLDFMRDHKSDLLQIKNTRPGGLTEVVFEVVIACLRKSQCKEMQTELFRFIQLILGLYSRPIFRYPNTFCGELCFEILKICDSKYFETRSKACSLIVLMIKSNYREMDHFSRMKLQTATAISRMFGPQRKEENNFNLQESIADSSSYSMITDDYFQNLKNSLKAISFYARGQFQAQKKFGKEVEELVNRLFSLTDANIEMEKYSFDPDTKAELYIKISHSYIDSPDLRVTQIEKLATLQQQERNYDSSANVLILMACLSVNYLRILGRCPAYMPDSDAFERVYPRIRELVTLPAADELTDLESEICQQKYFTEEGFVDLLVKASDLLERASMYESCVEVYNLLLPIYRYKRNYQKQSDCYAKLNALCNQIIHTGGDRLFPLYYRVVFYANGVLPEIDGKEFIYKTPGHIRLAEFTDLLINRFGKRVGSDKVIKLGNLKEVNRDELEPQRLYMQVISVKPFFDPEEMSTRPTEYEKNFDVSRFMYEVPFTKEGDPQTEDVTRQWKRKIILQVEDSFPHVLNRLHVVSRETIELPPIQNAIELNRDKIQMLNAELFLQAEAKTLGMLLYGILLAFVNAGPLPVARAFLENPEEVKDANESDIQELRDTYIEFVEVIAAAIEKNKTLIDSSELAVQNQFEIAYFDFKEEICRLCGIEPESLQEDFLKPAYDMMAGPPPPDDLPPPPSPRSAAKKKESSRIPGMKAVKKKIKNVTGESSGSLQSS